MIAKSQHLSAASTKKDKKKKKSKNNSKKNSKNNSNSNSKFGSSVLTDNSQLKVNSQPFYPPGVIK
jgi:hypothetical protein